MKEIKMSGIKPDKVFVDEAKEEKEIKKEKPAISSNRTMRRATAKRVRRQGSMRMKLAAQSRQIKESKKTADKLKKRLDKVREGAAKRIEVRKKIGKSEGVNWKRVVLLSKLEEGKVPEFSIKKV